MCLFARDFRWVVKKYLFCMMIYKNYERCSHFYITYPAGNEHENTLSPTPAWSERLLPACAEASAGRSSSLAQRAFSKQNVSEAEKAWYPQGFFRPRARGDEPLEARRPRFCVRKPFGHPARSPRNSNKLSYGACPARQFS